MIRKMRILILDDDYLTMEIFGAFLEKVEGFEVVVSAEQSILDRLAHERFDVIFLDGMIPTISLDANGNELFNIYFEGVPSQQTGIEFYRRLRRGAFTSQLGTSQDVPVIFCSAGHPNLDLASDPLLTKNIAYLEKPFDLSDAVEIISMLLSPTKGKNLYL